MLNKIKNKLDNFYQINANKSTFKIEIIAGISAFLAMSYILVVNPNNILWSGSLDPRFSSIFIATAFGGFVGSILMSIIAKMPYGMAPSLGINSLIGAIVAGSTSYYFNLGTALLLVMISSILVLLLSIIPCKKDKITGRTMCLREKILAGIPSEIKKAIPVGIGLFITMVGLQTSNIIVNNDNTLVSLVNFKDYSSYINNGSVAKALVCLFSLFVIAILSHFKVKGSIIFGIIAGTILAIPLGVANIDILLGKVEGISWNFAKNFKNFFSFDTSKSGLFSIFLETNIQTKEEVIYAITTIISITLITLFASIGTVYGLAKPNNLVDENNLPINYKKIILTDPISSIAGAMLGTTTIMPFAESGVGLATGGKTGFTSLVISILFILSLFLLPVFAFIPVEAASAALIYVGLLMISSIKEIDFTSIKEGLPAFLCIIIMLSAYNITDGIGVAVVSYVILNIIIYIINLIKSSILKQDKPKFEINLIILIIFILFLIYFLI